MAGRAAKFGEAVIKLSLLSDGIDNQLKKLQQKMAKFGSALKSIGRTGTMFAGAIAAPFAAAIKMAADAQETIAKFNSVFGDQAPAAKAFADQLAASVGRSAIAIQQAMSAYQSFFVGLGFGAEQSRQMSQQMQTLALDFAAFHNLADEDAMGRFISAMSGSSEVLDQFGVNIKQAALEEKLLEQGVRKAWTEVTEQEKAVARLAIIMESMTSQGAVGAAVRESGSFANQLKALQAKMSDLAIEIGGQLLPHVVSLMKSFNRILAVVKALGDWFPRLTSGLGGLAFALTGVAAAAWGVGAALTAISAHPLVALLSVGIAGIGFAISKAFGEATESVAELNAEFTKLRGHERKLNAVESWLGDIRNPQTWQKPKPPAQKPTTAAGGAFRPDAHLTPFINHAVTLAIDEAVKAGEGAAERAEKHESLVQKFVDERQRLDDEIARANIEAIKDEEEQRRAMLELEHKIRRRQLEADGILTAKMGAQLDELLAVQLAAVEVADPKETGRQAMEQVAAFDVRHAAQMYGGRPGSPMERAAIETAKNTRKMANKRNKEGIPVG